MTPEDLQKRMAELNTVAAAVRQFQLRSMGDAVWTNGLDPSFAEDDAEWSARGMLPPRYDGIHSRAVAGAVRSLELQGRVSWSGFHYTIHENEPCAPAPPA